MFEFPDSEGGKEERFGSGEGAGCGHGMFAIAGAVGATAWAAGFFAWLSFADGPRGGMGDGVAVHNYNSIPTYRNN